MRYIFLIFILQLLISENLVCQPGVNPTNKTDILLNEKTTDRPVNVHKGQFQFNFYYQFGIQSKKFDDERNKIDFSKDGRANLKHNYCLNLKYGLFENFEVSTTLPYAQSIEREVALIIFSVPYNELNQINEYKGFMDISLDMSYQIPLFSKNMYLSFNGGIFFPTAKYKPEQPRHEIDNNPNVYNVTANAVFYNYHYFNRLGDGVFKLQGGGIFKWKFRKMAFLSNVNYIKGLGEVENIKWLFELNKNEFEYKEYPYKMKRPDVIQFNGGIIYQALPWFSLIINLNSFNSFNGWSEESGKKIKNPEMNLLNFNPGFEIQITPHLRWTQDIGFPITGRNTYAPLFFKTGISLNYFPFN